MAGDFQQFPANFPALRESGQGHEVGKPGDHKEGDHKSHPVRLRARSVQGRPGFQSLNRPAVPTYETWRRPLFAIFAVTVAAMPCTGAKTKTILTKMILTKPTV